MKRKIATLALGLAAAGMISAPLAAAAPGDNASVKGNGKSVAENVKAGGAAAQKAADRAAKAADETRASVGKAVSEAAKSGGGSLAVLTTLSELKPDNQGIAKALANAIARLTPPVDPVDPIDPVDPAA